MAIISLEDLKYNIHIILVTFINYVFELVSEYTCFNEGNEHISSLSTV